MRNPLLIALFVGAALISAAIVPFFYWAPRVFDCRTNSDPSTFLAYCNSGAFTDYEHGAFFWNLEPEAVDSLKAARVLFLGNSRTQHGFSAEATGHYFRNRGVPYYIAGFDYGENMIFAQKLIKKYQLHPEVVVINSDDTFFSNEVKAIAAPMLEPETGTTYWKTFYNYLLKSGFSRIARPLCIQAPSLCTQTAPSLWRRRKTGEWVWRDTFPMNSPLPIQPWKRAPAPDEAAMQGFEKQAEIFLGTLQMPHQCIILTAVPNSLVTDEPIASRVGKRFQLPVIVPHLTGLTTIDWNHLDGPSAERWSQAFLEGASAVLDRCLTDDDTQFD
jgi:hypothetical protein